MQPGVVALSSQDDSVGVERLVAAVRAIGVDDPQVSRGPGLLIASWGLGGEQVGRARLLCTGARRHEQEVGSEDVARWLAAEELAPLAELLPPFAAAYRPSEEELVITADSLGFRHVYHAQHDGWAAAGTSARALAALGDGALDRTAVAVQCLLGWQVGQRTLFEGVTKLAPDSLVRLRSGRCHVERLWQRPVRRLVLDDAVDTAAEMLREHLTAYVEDHPDARIQLTGGQDSRILLSAVPPELRPSLTAITLDTPGSTDTPLAARIAARCGMRHEVESLDDLAGLEPAEVYDLCLASARSLETMSDPVALAGLTLAERRFDQGHRISGLGGEVARGFYYVGAPRGGVTRSRVARLTAWRMFANESAQAGALDADFRRWARDTAVDQIHAAMSSPGVDWLTATDEFYLDHRMQRWAGVTETAVCFDRDVVNPMLDDRFIALARGLSPADKRGSLFLARLQMALDPELGRIPLDGRPSPAAYARGGLPARTHVLGATARKASGKIRQRLVGGRRPPAGGDVLAGKVVQHWRRHPDSLDRVRGLGVLAPAWLDRMVSGEEVATPSSVALTLNLVVATEVVGEGVAATTG